MTVQEAKCKQCTKKCPQEKMASEIAKGRMYATNEFIQCQKELEQYRALGTVEELKEAREKQVAKKPTHHMETHPISPTTVNFETVYQCRNCHSIVKEEWNFCTLCGTKVDWSEEDD